VAALTATTNERLRAIKRPPPITTLFVDIGGVLLSDGWDHRARRRASTKFDLAWPDMETRHRLTFETYEQGKLTLEEYLDLVIFHERRTFSRATFRRFMFEQSKPFPSMIELIARLKAQHALKVVVVSNEARELNAYRIRKFKLTTMVDFFVSSCCVQMRKPDPDIFRLALELAQVSAEQVVYVENTPMFVQIAAALGIRGVVHVNARSTRAELASLGLPLSGATKKA